MKTLSLVEIGRTKRESYRHDNEMAKRSGNNMSVLQGLIQAKEASSIRVHTA